MDYIINALAVFPVIVFLVVIYMKDRLNPEPVGQLLKAFLYGVLSAPLSFFISIPFAGIGLYSDTPDSVFGAICTAFFGAAIPEETMKLLLLWFFLRNNKHFDEKVDGIVYAACVSLGFAALENVLYLYGNIDNFVHVAGVRAMFAVPGHFSFGILMGYYYSLAVFYPHSGRRKLNIAMTWCGPVLLHGIYDTLLFSIGKVNALLSLVIFCTFVVFCIKMWKYVAKRFDEHLTRDMAQGSEQERLQAVERFRHLAQKDPQRYESDFLSILNSTVNYYFELGQYARQEALSREMLEIHKRNGDTPSVANCLWNIAVGKQLSDQHQEALPLFAEAFSLLAEKEMHTPMALVLKDMAGSLLELEQYAKARHTANQAIELLRSSDTFTSEDRGTILPGLYSILGEAFLGEGLLGEADEQFLMAGNTLDPSLYDPSQQLRLYSVWSWCQSNLDQYQRCYDIAQKGLALSTDPQYADIRGEILHIISDACIFLGLHDQAEQYARECFELTSEVSVLSNLAASYIFRGMYAQAELIYTNHRDELSQIISEDFVRYENFGLITDELRPQVERFKSLLLQPSQPWSGND